MLMMICKSRSQLQRVEAKTDLGGHTCWMYRMLLRPNQGDDTIIGDKNNIHHVLQITINTRTMNKWIKRRTFILELGTKDSATLFRRLGSNLRQLRADMVILRSDSNLNSIEVMKDSAPT